MTLKHVVASRIAGAFLLVATIHLPSTAFAQENKSRIGQWDIIETRDPFTDRSRTMAFIPKEEAWLTLKCDEPGSVYALVLFDDWLGGRSEFRAVKLRFDAEPAYEQRWIYNERIAMIADYTEARSFIAKLLGANRLTVRAYDFEGRGHDVVFDLGDEKTSVVKKVYEGCAAGDPPPPESQTKQ